MDETKEKKKKILVADDDPVTLRIVSAALSRQGFGVLTARDGREALEKATREKPDAVLLDISMPELDGIEVCAKLKGESSTAKIPVGFLTAQKELESYKQAQKAGGMLYISKPIEPEKLIHFVSLLLSSRSGKSG